MNADPAFLRDFYRALIDRPLEPDEAWYVDLYTHELAPADPVEQLATCIEWSDLESTQLFSGFRGTGKSTELRRLRARLHRDPRYKVVLCDMIDYLNLSTPVDISDFLISVAGAFSEALAADPDLLGDDPGHEGYWTRFVAFLRETDVTIEGVSGEAPVVGAGLKANLRQDLTFRQRLRERMSGHLGALVEDVRAFLRECVQRLRARHGEDTRVVLLLDSVEQIRGTSIRNAEAVYASVEALFTHHADSLQFEELHVVYTVPPWLKIRSPGIAGSYSGSQLLPCVRVRQRDGTPWKPGLDALERIIGKRGDWERLLGADDEGGREVLDRLLLSSGGYLRDLFRLLQAALRRTRDSTLPVDAAVLAYALDEVRNAYLPITREDARWLDQVGTSNDPGLAVHDVRDGESNNLYNLSRFFDTHLVLCYRNGSEWYDVHPLLRAEVARRARSEAADPRLDER